MDYPKVTTFTTVTKSLICQLARNTQLDANHQWPLALVVGCGIPLLFYYKIENGMPLAVPWAELEHANECPV